MASHNTGSVFPFSIDPRMYYQDVQLSQLDVKANFDAALDNNQYTLASQILQNSDIDYYGAYFFNKSEDKLVAVQNHVDAKVKPVLTVYQATEPTTVENGLSWIS